ncbi:invasin domain 3-containing protein [Edwardsiella tarda]
MRTIRRTGCSPAIALMLGLLGGGPAWAASSDTDPVQGHVPTVSGVAIAPITGNPLEGDILRSDGPPLFNDVDGDTELNSQLHWYHEGEDAVIDTGEKHTLIVDDIGKKIIYGYTPATDPATSEPYLGEEVRSDASLVVQGMPAALNSIFALDKPTVIGDGSDTATLTLTLRDSENRPVTGIESRLTLRYEIQDGFSDGSPVITHPVESTAGSGVYTATVKSSSFGQVSVTPELSGTDLAMTPTSLAITFAAVTGLTTTANPYQFSASSGFPTTGFTGAAFQVLINDTAANNGQYTWSTDQPGWTSVDASGGVRFSGTPSSTTNTVTVSAEPTAGGSTVSYTFTVNAWFKNNGGNYGSWTVVRDWCSDKGGLPSKSQVSNGLNSARTVGTLWNEWGNLMKYGAGFINNYHWLSDTETGPNGAGHANVKPGDGSFTGNYDWSNGYMLCRLAL